MKKINNSNFELIEDLIKELNFNYNPQNSQNIDNVSNIWQKTVGEKIIKFAKVYNFSADNILTIICSDSFIANELYLEKQKLVDNMNKKAQEMGINIKDIKFDYKKWKEKHEK